MALQRRTASSTLGGASGTTSATINFTPAAVGDLLVLHVVNKLTSASPTTPSGWTQYSQHIGGGGTDGSGDGSGPVKQTIYYKRATSTAAQSVTVNVPSGNVVGVSLTSWYSTLGGEVNMALAATGSDTNDNLTLACTFGSTQAFNTSHKVLLFFGASDYIPGFANFGTLTLTATGATFTYADSHWWSEVHTNTGKNLSAYAWNFDVSGTATAAAALTCTMSTYTAMGALTLIALSESPSGTETGTFTESASVAVENPTATDGGTFSESAFVTYVNVDRSISDSDVGAVQDASSSGAEWTGDESGTFHEVAQTFIDPPSIVFNYNLNNPGYDISLSGLLDKGVEYETYSVYRRDPSGQYRDGYVRGMHGVAVASNTAVGSDYEAPIGVILDYYVELTSGVDTYTAGPIKPSPTSIPSQPMAYGRGVAYLKNVNNPQVARAVMIESMPTWRRSATVLAEHHVLGRSNPVVITDVLGGRKGDFTINVLMPEGQEIDEIYSILLDGGVLLLQNNNYRISGFKDLFFRVTGDVSVERRHLMVDYGALETPNLADRVFEVTIPFTEVDRPDTLGVVAQGDVTWQQVLTEQSTWTGVNTNNASWTEVTNG